MWNNQKVKNLIKKERVLVQCFCKTFLLFWTHSASRGSLWSRGERNHNNNVHVLWKRWSRRLSTNQRYFIALRHYSFSWHIMFLIKIACELIKMFIRVLFFFLLLLPRPCFSSTFMLKLGSILIPLLLLATNLAHRFYIKLAKTNKLNWKPLILKWPQKTEDGGGECPASLTIKPKLMQLASSKSIY